MIVYLRNGSWLKKVPRGADDYQTFAIDEQVYPTLQDARRFCKLIVTDNDSLVRLRNQLTFLLTELYGERHSSHFDIPFERSTIFWAWVFLPGEEAVNGCITSHDLVYVKREITDKEVRKIQSTMRQLNLHVFARNVRDQKSVCSGVKAVAGDA